ncbi:ribose 1,5-bisphosphokinase PhnN [Rhizobium sp. AN70]|nr:ribose 1,5-bisphosphokinase PhnN [Rhizobium sp. AN70]
MPAHDIRFQSLLLVGPSGAGEDFVSRARNKLNRDDELVWLCHRLIVACSASMDDWMPASVDMVKSSISRLTQPL